MSFLNSASYSFLHPPPPTDASSSISSRRCPSHLCQLPLSAENVAFNSISSSLPPGNCHLKFISQRLQNKYTNKTILSSASSSPPLLQLHSDAGTLGRTLHSFNAKGEEQVSCQTTSLSSDHCHLQSSSSCKPNKLCTYSSFSAFLSSPLQCLNGISKTCFIAPLWH